MYAFALVYVMIILMNVVIIMYMSTSHHASLIIVDGLYLFIRQDWYFCDSVCFCKLQYYALRTGFVLAQCHRICHIILTKCHDMLGY